MSGFDDKIGLNGKKNHDENAVSDVHDLLGNENWEARLAAARTAREKILKEKGRSQETTPIKPPYLIEPPGHENSSPPAEDTAESATALDETFLLYKNKFGTAAKSSGKAARQTGRRLALPVVATVTFACFFGLGSGIILAYGALVKTGWLSASTAVEGEKETTTARVAAGPQVEPAEVLSSPAIEQPDTGASSIYTAFDSQESGEVQPPSVLTQLPTGRIGPLADPSGSEFGVGEMDLEEASQSQFQPSELSVILENPVHLSFSSGTVHEKDTLLDEVGFLPEKSNIDVMVAMAGLTPPPLDQGKQLTFDRSVEEKSGQVIIALTPVLQQVEPTEFPQVFSDPSPRFSVFDGELPQFAVAFSAGNTSLPNFPSATPPPEIPVARTIRSFDKNDLELPNVGAAREQRGNLAALLGFDPVSASMIELVTFAPKSISDDGVAKNTEFLESTGFVASAVNRVNYRVSNTQVRYYRSQDEGVASALASEIGGIVRDFTNVANPPSMGLIEVYLKGEGSGARTTTGTPPKLTAAQRLANQKAQLERNIVNSLRRGEQFGPLQ